MVIQSRMMLGGIAGVLVLGAAVWCSVAAWAPSQHGSVEIRQLDAASWAVEITELGAASDGQPGAAAR